ncbi:ferritin-like domain-containing protein [Marinicrinis lubricantis]|uniref:Ferritin-like domain-containing protein n=1 Tax=Marinicrinis lubricantis TaxID=2086470 RepID=A0ABW1IM22_9BACL
MHSNPYAPADHLQAELIHDLAKAIDGQYSAILCYGQLARLAPTEAIREQILEIRSDEIRHFQAFMRIYICLTGHSIRPQVTEPCPDTYDAGLHFAFRDEQKTVDFYLEIAEKTHDPYIKSIFRRAAADEQNHAVWFLYFLNH